VFVCPSACVCLASHAPALQRTPISYVAAHKVPAFSRSIADNNFNNYYLLPLSQFILVNENNIRRTRRRRRRRRRKGIPLANRGNWEHALYFRLVTIIIIVIRYFVPSTPMLLKTLHFIQLLVINNYLLYIRSSFLFCHIFPKISTCSRFSWHFTHEFIIGALLAVHRYLRSARSDATVIFTTQVLFFSQPVMNIPLSLIFYCLFLLKRF